MAYRKTNGAYPDANPDWTADEVAAPDVATYWSATSNPLRGYAWHLDGYLTPGGNVNGANVDKISTEYTGHGVRIGLIDEGFDLTNPDLANRFDLAGSYDPRDPAGNINIAPDDSTDIHGTWVAGVVGAADDNGGTVGVAPGSTLVGFYARYGAGGSSRAEMSDLLARQVNVDISNNSWGYTTEFADNFLDPAWFVMRDAIHTGVTNGRDGLGTIYVFAAGNDRQYVANSTYDGDNTNYHNLTNSRHVITAAASTSDGHIAPFSTPGASILVTAPGVSIVTTTLDDGDGNPNDNYTFVSGTSFAAPIVSGVVAMMLEANPDLGYRDVQEILALSAHKIDPASASWGENGVTNWNGGANLVSNDFGFGLVDAHAAVRLAETWTTTHTAANEAVISLAGDVGSDTAIVDLQPKNYTTTVSSAYQNFAVQWVEVDVSLLHTHDGDLRIELISPTGTTSVLMDQPAAGNNARNNLTFTFSTNHDWGESPVGTWTLVVTDMGGTGTGSMVSYSIRIYGDDHGTNDTYYYTDDFATLSAGYRDTLTDTGGMDTINAAAVTTDLSLDLSAGATSSIAGHLVVTTASTIIENAYGGDGNDTIVGNAADNHLFGGHGNDTLQGAAGNDTLDGGIGADALVGGLGNDTYVVDNPGDLVTENAGEGIDTIHTTLNAYTLGSDLENLSFIGAGNFVGTGNELDNVIIGGAGADTLHGGAGNDTLDGGAGADALVGGAGNDTYVVDNLGDVISENFGEGIDIVKTTLQSYTLQHDLENLAFIGTGNFVGIGNELNNVLTGGAGADSLDGKAGADTMIGGAGNDLYFVDNPGDVVIENTEGGYDTVYSYVSYTLSSNVETLFILGGSAGTGNGLDNLLFGAYSQVGLTLDGGNGNDTIYGSSFHDNLIGGAGNDVIFGLGGGDVMSGGMGDDTYFVYSAGDIVHENPGEGFDTVYAAVPYTLPDNVELLFSFGGAVTSVTGNASDNVLLGVYASASQTIDGSAGNDGIYGSNYDDLLMGGAGNDFMEGFGGNDIMRGGAGDDVYIVEQVGDVVQESANEGNDIVYALVNYTLPANVETLYTYGAVTSGTGNDQDNVIVGVYTATGVTLAGKGGNDLIIAGSGNDTIIGGAGSDAMIGGAGNDTFEFHPGEVYGDTIVDFNGNGAGAGDLLEFVGFGPGATFTQVDTTLWQVNYNGGHSHELMAFSNAASIHPGDVLFF